MTGTRSIDVPTGHEILFLRMSWLAQFDRFVTGGCKGWDAIAGEWLLLAFPDRHHVVVVPGNLSQVDPWWLKYDVKSIVSIGFTGSFDVIEMPPGSSYKARSQRLVAEGDELFYCAQFPESHGASNRSGTWQTYRLAKAKEMPIEGEVLVP